MSKRRRGVGGVRVTAPRPIDKTLTVLTKTTVGSSTVTTDIFTATTACTALGVRWNFYVEGDAGTEGTPHDYIWMIVLVPDGTSINAISLTDAAQFYKPEQHVMAFGLGSSRGDASGADQSRVNLNWSGQTKTMRKLRIGDKITFGLKGIATETVRCRGVVQMFCKS